MKWLGDGVMFHFPDPGRACCAALDMVDGVASQGFRPPTSGSTPGR